jgi:hypothetical protein
MWAVRTRMRVIAVFDYRDEAEQWCRDWRSVHGMGAWVTETER